MSVLTRIRRGKQNPGEKKLGQSKAVFRCDPSQEARRSSMKKSQSNLGQEAESAEPESKLKTPESSFKAG